MVHLERVSIREPFPHQCMPRFHQSPSFVYKLACAAVCRFPLTTKFDVSILQCVSPLCALIVLLFSIYSFPVLFSRREHVYFLSHVTSVLMQTTLCVNAVLAMLVFNVSAAPFAALLASVHVCVLTANSLAAKSAAESAARIPNLMPHQESTVRLLQLGTIAILGVSWATVPRVNLDAEAAIVAMFMPEAVGTVVALINYWALSGSET